MLEPHLQGHATQPVVPFIRVHDLDQQSGDTPHHQVTAIHLQFPQVRTQPIIVCMDIGVEVGSTALT